MLCVGLEIVSETGLSSYKFNRIFGFVTQVLNSRSGDSVKLAVEYLFEPTFARRIAAEFHKMNSDQIRTFENAITYKLILELAVVDDYLTGLEEDEKKKFFQATRNVSERVHLMRRILHTLGDQNVDEDIRLLFEINDRLTLEALPNGLKSMISVKVVKVLNNYSQIGGLQFLLPLILYSMVFFENVSAKLKKNLILNVLKFVGRVEVPA